MFHYEANREPWPAILESLGFTAGNGGIRVVGSGADPREVESGGVMIVEGPAESLGIRAAGSKLTPVRNIVDVHNPRLQIIWDKAVPLPAFELPPGAEVFARERWQGLPLMAGIRRGSGVILWLAASPGKNGHERFPYIAQALADLGVKAPLRSKRLWAFFDASYRSRVDLDYFAKRWRQSGIAALHVAAWHFFDPNPERDAYLKKLVEACHRNAILVYAWIELPHVSEKFWNDHPEWREKTAIGQDAHLDWRKLMNLQNPDCARAAAGGLKRLIEWFDWDGVNLAELYFESLEGAANPARFTPMNEDVRREFSGINGFDPLSLFEGGGDESKMRQFLEYRADLARRMQEHWIEEIDRVRKAKPDLHLILTHVDDRYDTRMKDLIGADASRLLPLLSKRDFTFLVEDPATLWHLGPERSPEIAARYKPVTPRPEKLAIDINVVERYQDVYPTKQQTGTELFRLVHLASAAFPRVALYFENSLLPVDLGWLPSAGAAGVRIDVKGDGLVVESPRSVGVPWNGPVSVDGNPWPYQDRSTVWLPSGAHALSPSPAAPPLRILDFSGEIRSLQIAGRGIELAYESESRAWMLLESPPSHLAVDGVKSEGGRTALLALPRGQHILELLP
jgi:hypothetical protein